MIILYSWISRLPLIRSRIYHPVIYLRGDALTEVRRYGVMPDGVEADLGSTVDRTLAWSKEMYLFKLNAGLHGPVPRFLAPIRVEGTDFAPLPKISAGSPPSSNPRPTEF